WPDPTLVCPELGRRPTSAEHFTIYALRLKALGCAIHACGSRVRHALRDWQPPLGVDPDSEDGRAARFAHYILRRAAEPACVAAALENDLRRTCTEVNAPLLKTLFVPCGWLGQLYPVIRRAIFKQPRCAAPPPRSDVEALLRDGVGPSDPIKVMRQE